MFVALLTTDRSRIEANIAEKLCSHICPKCKEKVDIVRGKIKRPHFRHQRNSNCSYGEGETWQHQEAKHAILDGARARGLAASPEVEVLSVDGDRRADVVLWSPASGEEKHQDARRLAFEVQYSALEDNALRARTTAYMIAGVPVLWIPVIDAAKFKNLRSVVDTNLFVAEAYATPSWVLYIKAMHGHLWLYVPQTKAFWKGHLTSHYRWRDGKEWYDPSGEFQQTQGHWFPLAKARDLYLEGPFRFEDLRIVRVDHSKNERFGPEKGRKFLVDLIPPGGEKGDPARAEKRRVEQAEHGYYYHYDDWVMTCPPDFHPRLIRVRT